jgi:hypothetical protein
VIIVTAASCRGDRKPRGPIGLSSSRSSSDLPRQVASPYRPGCWDVSDAVSNAVTQIKKTAFELARDRFRDRLKGCDGADTRGIVYSVQPRSYMVVGNLAQLEGNDEDRLFRTLSR